MSPPGTRPDFVQELDSKLGLSYHYCTQAGVQFTCLDETEIPRCRKIGWAAQQSKPIGQGQRCAPQSYCLNVVRHSLCPQPRIIPFTFRLWPFNE